MLPRLMRDWQNLILRAFAAAGVDGRESDPLRQTYVLSGPTDRRVNISAQQHRALNLVAALVACGKLQRDSVLGVVGAGVGGWTAAVAAAQQNITVHLFDEHEEMVSTQRAAAHRPVHPNLYDWPVPGCTDEAAGVAFCNWEAASAASMRAQVVASGLAELKALPGRLAFWRQAVVTGVREASKVTITFAQLADLVKLAGYVDVPDDLPDRSLEVDVVIVATGFLPEPRCEGSRAESGSYWRPTADPPRASTINIAGDGDSALNEVLNHALGPDIADLAALVAPTLAPTFATRLRDLEARHRTRLNRSTTFDLQASNLDALDDGLLEQVRGTLGDRPEPGEAPIRLFTKSGPMSASSFLLNRFLVSRLIRLGYVHLIPVKPRLTATDFDQLHGSGYWRIGSAARDRTLVAAPSVRQKELAQTIGADRANSVVAGVVEDLLDMTRHAWRRQPHEPVLTRAVEPESTSELEDVLAEQLKSPATLVRQKCLSWLGRARVHRETWTKGSLMPATRSPGRAAGRDGHSRRSTTRFNSRLTPLP